MSRRRARPWRVTLAALSLVAAGAPVAACSGDGDGGGGAGGSAADFCATMREVEGLQSRSDALFERTDVPVDEVREVYASFDAALDRLVGTAPDEVASDARLVADTTQRLIAAFERADYDFTALATDPQYAEVLVSLDEARITEANDRLAAYVRAECAGSRGSTSSVAPADG